MIAAAAVKRDVAIGKWIMSLAIIVGLVVIGFLLPYGTVLGLAPLEKSPEVMAERARQIISRLGYSASPADSVYWYELDNDFLRYCAIQNLGPVQGKDFWSASPGPTRFVYRQSPLPLDTLNSVSPVTRFDPPENISGMITLMLDASGRLLYLSAVPHQVGGVVSPTDADWTTLLAESGVDTKTIAAATPRWLPPHFSDARAAWDGSIGGRSIHLMAAACSGKPVYFRVVWPWMSAERSYASGESWFPFPLIESEGSEKNLAGTLKRLSVVTLVLLVLAAFTVCIIVARKHVRTGRGDRKGAVRIAVVMFASWTVMSVPVLHWVGKASSLYFRIIIVTGIALFFASFAYASYLTIEPYFRRRWPHLLVSFHRMLSGRLQDARVGRDVIGGSLIGVLMAVINYLSCALGARFNLSGEPPVVIGPPASAGIGEVAQCAAGSLGFAIFWALLLAVMLTVGRALLHRNRLAWLFVAVLCSCMAFREGHPLLRVTVGVLCVTLLLVAANQFGILGSAVAYFVCVLIFLSFLTADFSRWYFWSGALSLTIVVTLAVYGFRAALAGRPVFGHAILED